MVHVEAIASNFYEHYERSKNWVHVHHVHCNCTLMSCACRSLVLLVSITLSISCCVSIQHMYKLYSTWKVRFFLKQLFVTAIADTYISWQRNVTHISIVYIPATGHRRFITCKAGVTIWSRKCMRKCEIFLWYLCPMLYVPYYEGPKLYYLQNYRPPLQQRRCCQSKRNSNSLQSQQQVELNRARAKTSKTASKTVVMYEYELKWYLCHPPSNIMEVLSMPWRYMFLILSIIGRLTQP